MPATKSQFLRQKSPAIKRASVPFVPGLLAIVAYDQLRTFEYSIAAEVFALQRPSLGITWYPSIVVAAEPGPLRGIAGVEIRADAKLSALARAQTIVIPGWRDFDLPPPAALLNALRRAAKRGARILSICSGAYVLAAAGLLDGRRATTHWLFTDQLRQKFPAVQFEDDVLYVDAGNIITSSGSAAGIDACLHLVRRDFGAVVANKVARRMVAAPHREGGQAQYVESPVARDNLGRGADHRLIETLAWVRKRLAQPLSVNAMAKHALMSARSFSRHFNEALGMTPSAWLQRERIACARELLERTGLTHGEIGAKCGYTSLETFRVAFRRSVGVSPSAYRLHFTGERQSRS
jgi:AraC family transcriptional regulator, transcriptional activator FtrA